jgi:hypothetical protein
MAKRLTCIYVLCMKVLVMVRGQSKNWCACYAVHWMERYCVLFAFYDTKYSHTQTLHTAILLRVAKAIAMVCLP